jgi:hypothetical protein
MKSTLLLHRIDGIVTRLIACIVIGIPTLIGASVGLVFPIPFVSNYGFPRIWLSGSEGYAPYTPIFYGLMVIAGCYLLAHRNKRNDRIVYLPKKLKNKKKREAQTKVGFQETHREQAGNPAPNAKTPETDFTQRLREKAKEIRETGEVPDWLKIPTETKKR